MRLASYLLHFLSALLALTTEIQESPTVPSLTDFYNNEQPRVEMTLKLLTVVFRFMNLFYIRLLP